MCRSLTRELRVHLRNSAAAATARQRNRFPRRRHRDVVQTHRFRPNPVACRQHTHLFALVHGAATFTNGILAEGPDGNAEQPKDHESESDQQVA